MVFYDGSPTCLAHISNKAKLPPPQCQWRPCVGSNNETPLPHLALVYLKRRNGEPPSLSSSEEPLPYKWKKKSLSKEGKNGYVNINKVDFRANYLLKSIKIAFRAKKITRNRERHYIMIKEPIYQENIATLNVYTPNNRIAKYVKQKLIKLK